MKVSCWGDQHCPKWLGFVRIALGLFLVYKGLNYMFTIEKIQVVTDNVDQALFYMMLFQIVIFVHFVGGIFITIGIFTKLAGIVQVPILIGALAAVKYPNGYITPGGPIELGITILTLVLLFVIMIFGSGGYSIRSMGRGRLEPNLNH